ncbi:unnamed protein product [Echinostoma caproni]|uniref:DUF3883 domain-containing protein n=1 Tax=Echinostoma caproni TaxID=27848 RepID=A0A183AXP2_9TREM|nr:unnamed protein product [Echinostoma caproni]
MAKHSTELFPSEDYISDYESETSSHADARSVIRSAEKRDIDVIREHGRFLWSEKDEPASWSERLAKRYWDKLFKEYCLVDLSRYKENKFGMRWRLEKEVISGKEATIQWTVAISELTA